MKGDHIYVEGTLVSSTYEKEFAKGKSKITVPFKACQVKADSIRKETQRCGGDLCRVLPLHSGKMT